MVCSFDEKAKILANRKKVVARFGRPRSCGELDRTRWCYSESERSGTGIFKRAKEELLCEELESKLEAWSRRGRQTAGGSPRRLGVCWGQRQGLHPLGC